MQILFQIFLCSLTGATGNQVFYFVGLENSTPTIGCALANILPAVTFILAVIFRQETVKIKKRSGQAKVLGTVICVGGAMLLSFYHGHLLGIPASKIHWDFVDKVSKDDTATKSNFILGSMELLASSTSWAVWFIIQNKVSEKFPAPYTSTTLMCFMGSVECGAIALITNHQLSDWSLKSTIRLIASLHAGILGSGLGFYLTSWCIQRRGALYVSVFSPLLLVAVAIASWALLREKLYVGTVVGSVMIVGGLYTVLWGKDKEIQSSSENKEKNKKGAGGDNTDLEDHQEMPTANLNCKHQTAEG